MDNSLLEKISVGPHQVHITDQWANAKTGSIVDIQGNCVYRFVDYLECGNDIRIKYKTDEEKIAHCPVVASGIVGYWFHYYQRMNTKKLFESYFDWRYKQYEKAHENDDDAWERDLIEEFVKREHIVKEGKIMLDKTNTIPCVCHHSPDKGFLIDLNIMLFHFPKHLGDIRSKPWRETPDQVGGDR